MSPFRPFWRVYTVRIKTKTCRTPSTHAYRSMHTVDFAAVTHLSVFNSAFSPLFHWNFGWCAHNKHKYTRTQACREYTGLASILNHSQASIVTHSSSVAGFGCWFPASNLGSISMWSSSHIRWTIIRFQSLDNKPKWVNINHFNDVSALLAHCVYIKSTIIHSEKKVKIFSLFFSFIFRSVRG